MNFTRTDIKPTGAGANRRDNGECLQIKLGEGDEDSALFGAAGL